MEGDKILSLWTLGVNASALVSSPTVRHWCLVLRETWPRKGLGAVWLLQVGMDNCFCETDVSPVYCRWYLNPSLWRVILVTSLWTRSGSLLIHAVSLSISPDTSSLRARLGSRKDAVPLFIQLTAISLALLNPSKLLTHPMQSVPKKSIILLAGSRGRTSRNLQRLAKTICLNLSPLLRESKVLIVY